MYPLALSIKSHPNIGSKEDHLTQNRSEKRVADLFSSQFIVRRPGLGGVYARVEGCTQSAPLSGMSPPTPTILPHPFGGCCSRVYKPDRSAETLSETEGNSPDAQLTFIAISLTSSTHSKMKAIIIALCFIGTMTVVNAQLLTAAAIIIGAKILIGKGFIYGAAKGALARNIASGNGFNFGGRSRGGHGHKREADPAGDFNAVLLEQTQKDVDECAKLLVCTLNAKPLNKLDVSLPSFSFLKCFKISPTYVRTYLEVDLTSKCRKYTQATLKIKLLLVFKSMNPKTERTHQSVNPNSFHLQEDEFAIASAFGQADVIDVTLPTVLYDVAAHVGRMAGEKQCKTVYPRCNAEVDSIMKEIKKAVYGQ